jgi:hypothetical protein
VIGRLAMVVGDILAIIISVGVIVAAPEILVLVGFVTGVRVSELLLRDDEVGVGVNALLAS